MNDLSGRAASLITGISVALVIVAISIVPFLSSQWIAFAQDRAQAAAWTGFTPGELRHAEWSEIDWEKAVWHIPANKMKSRVAHAVPLSQQAVALLREIEPLTCHSRYVFPSLRTPKEPMSENTINGALRRLGYSGDEMTAHGFRATASTLLNESGKWHPDAIERALAHKDSDNVRAAYHRGAHWEERVRMAQWWSDHLDTLREGATVIPITRGRR